MAIVPNYLGLKISGSKVIERAKPRGDGDVELRWRGVCHCDKYFIRTKTQLQKAKVNGVLECNTCANTKKKQTKALATKPSKKPSKVQIKKGDAGHISLHTLWEAMSHREVAFDEFYRRFVQQNWTLKKSLSTPPAPETGDVGRRNITTKVTAAAIGYLVKGGYAVYREMGIRKWGARRVDICGINLYGYLVVVEVKSGMADFRADKKMHEYLQYANKMYVAFPHTMKITDAIKKEITSQGIGIMVLEANGLIRVRSRAKHRLLNPKDIDELKNRMIWRGAISSARTTKRTKEFL